MAIVDFKDVPVGASFTYNNKTYQKISPVKVSCCTTLNAIANDEVKNKIMVRPLEKVEFNEQQ
jgi:hypothetical protein